MAYAHFTCLTRGCEWQRHGENVKRIKAVSKMHAQKKKHLVAGAVERAYTYDRRKK